MFYAYFRTLNLISNIFGLPKPLITADGKPTKINFWLKLWSLLVAGSFIGSFYFSIHRYIKSNLKDDMEIIIDINDLVTNIIIIMFNLINGEIIYINLHELVDSIFIVLNMNRKILKLFAYKMYLWYFTPLLIYLILIGMEIMYLHPPFILLIRMPTFLSNIHLIMHLLILLALVKVINHQLSGILNGNDKVWVPNMILGENMKTGHIVKYVFSPKIEFIKIDNLAQFDLKFLCKFYDDLSTCVYLLEKCFGLQIFLSIWAMFTSGVVGVTVIVSNQPPHKWLVVTKSVLPLFWSFIGCFINDQISKQVEHTITQIIKCLIDFKCVPAKKTILETFKELVTHDRLQFTAGSLFKIGYAMLCGTLLNIITYSIIIIQML